MDSWLDETQSINNDHVLMNVSRQNMDSPVSTASSKHRPVDSAATIDHANPDPDIDHFRQYVSATKNHTKPSSLSRMASIYGANGRPNRRQPNSLMSLNGGFVTQKSAHVVRKRKTLRERYAQNEIQKKQKKQISTGNGFEKLSNSDRSVEAVVTNEDLKSLSTTSEPKPQWNSRLVTGGIPEYDSSKDRHVRLSKKTKFKALKTTPTVPAVARKSPMKTHYSPFRSRSGPKQRVANNQTVSMTHRSNSTRPPRPGAKPRPSVVRNGWVNGSANKENQAPTSSNAPPHDDKVVKELEMRLIRTEHETAKVLETKENDIKQLKHDKLVKEKLLEKVKERYQKIKESAALLKEEKEQMEKKLKRLSKGRRKYRGSVSSSVSSTSHAPTAISSATDDETRLKESLAKHKQHVTELQNELSMFKTQNQLLRAQERENRHLDDLQEEVQRLRKKLRFEQERSKRAMEQAKEDAKSSDRIEKLRTYLEREKKDHSKQQSLNKRMQKEYDDLKLHLDQANSKISQLDKERAELAQKLAQVREALLSQKSVIQTMETKNLDLTNQIKAMEMTTNGAARAKTHLSKQIEEKDEDLKRVARRVTELEKEKSDVEIQYHSLRTDFDQLKKKYEDSIRSHTLVQKLESQNADLQAQLKRLEKQIVELKQSHANRIESESKSKHDAETELEHRMKELREMKNQMSILQIDKEKQSKEMAQLKTQIQNLQKEKENNKQSDELEDLRKKLQEATDRCSVLSESNALLLMRLKREEAKRS